MKSKISVIGQSGSVGVTLEEKLQAHPVFSESWYDPGVESWSLLSANEQAYQSAILKVLDSAELVVLCVADEIAQNIMKLIEPQNSDVKIIDCSTAHRVNKEWGYGLPELPGQRTSLLSTPKVANPGCHATAMNLTLAPLKTWGLSNVACHSVTGYSGGGKAMIAQFESDQGAPWAYSVGLHHKHLPEVEAHSGIKPFFQPVVIPESQGILCSTWLPEVPTDDVLSAYSVYAEEPFVQVTDSPTAKVDMTAHNGTNQVSLSVVTHEMGTQVISILDNLGKGSAGAVIQNANVMLGLSETLGLIDQNQSQHQ